MWVHRVVAEQKNNKNEAKRRLAKSILEVDEDSNKDSTAIGRLWGYQRNLGINTDDNITLDLLVNADKTDKKVENERYALGNAFINKVNAPEVDQQKIVDSWKVLIKIISLSAYPLKSEEKLQKEQILAVYARKLIENALNSIKQKLTFNTEEISNNYSRSREIITHLSNYSEKASSGPAGVAVFKETHAIKQLPGCYQSLVQLHETLKRTVSVPFSLKKQLNLALTSLLEFMIGMDLYPESQQQYIAQYSSLLQDFKNIPAETHQQSNYNPNFHQQALTGAISRVRDREETIPLMRRQEPSLQQESSYCCRII